MKRWLAVIASLCWLTGPALAGETIETQRYSLEAPPGVDWKISRHAGGDVVELMGRGRGAAGGEVSTVLVVVPHDVSGAYGATHTERWLADDIRRQEESNMITLGVERGLYRLKDVDRFDVEMGGKAGYAMTYTQVIDGVQARGYLYLYFPDDFAETGVLYKFVCSKIGRKRDLSDPPWPDLEAAVSSFTVSVGVPE